MIDAGNLDTDNKDGDCCKKCLYWYPLLSVAGKCRRMPPSAHFESGHYWPVTGRGDWCGEFKSSEVINVQGS